MNEQMQPHVAHRIAKTLCDDCYDRAMAVGYRLPTASLDAIYEVIYGALCWDAKKQES
jgi:hypothetical protein